MKQIISATNPALKQLARLIRSARERSHTQQAVLEGVHLTAAFMQAGHNIKALYVPQHRRANVEVAALINRLPENKIIVVADAALSRITSLNHADDIISITVLPPPAELPENGDCVVLQKLQDPGNVGTILRTAAAAGIGQIILSADCADVWSPKVLRAGMGAQALLRLFPDTDLAAWRPRYRHNVYATALSADSTSLYGLDLRAPAAWLFGNEGTGLCPTAQASANKRVQIPMTATSESLNVAMAATVCLFEQRRQRLAKSA